MFWDIVRVLLIFVEIICCLLLVGVILIQRSRGQGVGLGFGAAMTETIFGSQTGNFLTRTTIILGAVFLVNTTLLAVLESRRRVETREASVVDTVVPAPAAGAQAPAGLPAQGPAGAPPVAVQPQVPQPAGAQAPIALPPSALPTQVKPVVIPSAAPAAGSAVTPAASTPPVTAIPADVKPVEIPAAQP